MLEGKTKSKVTILWVFRNILRVEKRACIQSASSQLLYTQQKNRTAKWLVQKLDVINGGD